MKNAAERAQCFEALLKQAEIPPAPASPDERDAMAVLVFSFLLWESSTPAAVKAYKAIRNRMVDFNEFRVALPREVVGMIGEKYPLADERARRLLAALNDVFHREHTLCFDRFSGGKREIRKYVESLEGMTPFVAMRLCLISFDTHGIPVDEQLRALLIEREVIGPDSDAVEASNFLARHVKAGEALAAHRMLQGFVDAAALARAATEAAASSLRKKSSARAGAGARGKKTTAAKSAPKPKTSSRSSKR